MSRITRSKVKQQTELPFTFQEGEIKKGQLNYIRKIDDPYWFNLIDSGYTTSYGLKEVEKKQVSTWFNEFKEQGIVGETKADIMWISTHWEKIYNWIKLKYNKKEIKASTYRFHLDSIANVLLAIDKHNEQFKNIARKMFLTTIALQKEIDIRTGENLLEEEDLVNFVCFKDVLTKFEEYQVLWGEDKSKLKVHMNFLILCFATLIPPMRLNVLNTDFYLDSDEQPPTDTKTNYLWRKKNGRWMYQINHDKIENKRQLKGLDKEIFELNDEMRDNNGNLIIKGRQLGSILDESLKVYPRKHVLLATNLKDVPMSDNSYRQALSVIFHPLKPTQNLLRKSYINEYYSNQRLSSNQLDEIARRMRHTQRIARLAYEKLNIVCPPTGAPQLNLNTVYLRVPDKLKHKEGEEPEELLLVPKEKKKYNHTEHSKIYRENNKEAITQKRKEAYQDPVKRWKLLRSKMVSNLNKNNAKTPQENTIFKYGLVYNEETKKWRSTKSEPTPEEIEEMVKTGIKKRENKDEE